MSAMRWGKFWWSDWESDPGLRMCSLAAQGLWMRLLCVMARSEEEGRLIVGGSAPDHREIGRLVGADPRTIQALIAELERHGVFSRCDDSVIYSRRMVREAQARDRARKNGKMGGNPLLVGRRPEEASPKPAAITQGVNPSLKLEAEAEAEKERTPHSPPEGGGASPSQAVGKAHGQARAEGKAEGKARKVQATELPAAWVPVFEAFWGLFPRRMNKHAGGRDEAQKAFARATKRAGDDPEMIVMALKVALGTDHFDMRENGQFVPHASSWLNQGRWKDVLEKAARDATIEEAA